MTSPRIGDLMQDEDGAWHEVVGINPTDGLAVAHRIDVESELRCLREIRTRMRDVAIPLFDLLGSLQGMVLPGRDQPVAHNAAHSADDDHPNTP